MCEKHILTGSSGLEVRHFVTGRDFDSIFGVPRYSYISISIFTFLLWMNFSFLPLKICQLLRFSISGDLTSNDRHIFLLGRKIARKSKEILTRKEIRLPSFVLT